MSAATRHAARLQAAREWAAFVADETAQRKRWAAIEALEDTQTRPQHTEFRKASQAEIDAAEVRVRMIEQEGVGDG